jgi:hypothetical protein
MVSNETYPAAAARRLANHEVVTLAVYLLDGATRPVDREDIAVKANELAPGRFAWRKYPAQISLEIIRVALTDAKKEKNGSYLAGRGDEGWVLTERGLDFARSMIESVQEVDLSRGRRSDRDARWLAAERSRLLSSDAYREAREHGVDAVTTQAADAFFRVDEYVVGPAREQKVVRVLDAFGDDPELGEVARGLAARVRRSP